MAFYFTGETLKVEYLALGGAEWFHKATEMAVFLYKFVFTFVQHCSFPVPDKNPCDSRFSSILHTNRSLYRGCSFQI